MTETRAQLQIRKDDLIAALRLLEQDYGDGLIGQEAYQSARRRYELEAAQVLERLDTLPVESAGGAHNAAGTTPTRRRRASPVMLAAAAALVAVAIAVSLGAALHARGSGTRAGGVSDPATAPAASPRLLAAERQVLEYPRSSLAFLELGNAYLADGQASQADGSYRRAMQLAPSNPQPPTLHAMIIGYRGQRLQALRVLHSVERRHPGYSRAWLLDGVFSASGRAGYRHALVAWQRFLSLEPHSSMTGQVQAWIRSVRKAEGKGSSS